MKLFTSKEEMNNSSGNKDGDLGIIYNEKTIPITQNAYFKKIILKRTFTLSEPVPSGEYYYLEGYGSDKIHSEYENITLTSSYLELGEGAGMDDANSDRWTSEDGQTYTWVDTYEDWETMETITKEWKGYKEYKCSISFNSEYENWTDLFSEIFSIVTKEYHGLYKYQEDEDPQYIMSFKNIKTELYEEEEFYPWDPEDTYTVTKVRIKSYDTTKVDVEDLYDKIQSFISDLSYKYGIYIINRDSNNKIETIARYTSYNATYLFMDENNHLWISTSWDSGTAKAYSFTKKTYNLKTNETSTETVMSSWKEFGNFGWYYKLIEDITDKEIILLSYKSDTTHLITYSATINQIYQNESYTDTTSVGLVSSYTINSKWFPAENQTTLKDPNNVIGNYTWIGPEDEITSENTWSRYINKDRFQEIIPYFDTNNKRDFYYGYNKLNVPGGHLLVPANLKYVTKDNLIQDYLYNRHEYDVRYGYEYTTEYGPKIDLNNVPNISACDGYLYQMNNSSTINNNIISSLIYGSRSNYAYFIQINLDTNTVITKKSIQVLSSKSNSQSVWLCWENDTYWVLCATSDYTARNTTPSRTFVVINKSNGNKYTNWTFTSSTAGTCYAHNIDDISFSGTPSSSTLNMMLYCKYYSNSTYTAKVYKIQNGSHSLVVNMSSPKYSITENGLAFDEVILAYQDTESSDVVYKMFIPEEKTVYSPRQVVIQTNPDGISKYKYSYGLTNIPYSQDEDRYIMYNNQEILIKDLPAYAKTLNIDGVEYSQNATLNTLNDDIEYDGKMIRVSDEAEIEIAIPTNYYNLISRNNYQYESRITVDYDEDHNWDGSTSTYSYFARKKQYVFTACELKPIETLNDSEDNLVMIDGHSTLDSKLKATRDMYFVTKDNLDKLINN